MMLMCALTGLDEATRYGTKSESIIIVFGGDIMLTIRSEQIRILKVAAFERFIHAAVAHVQRFFPGRVAGLDDAELRQIIGRMADNAAVHGLKSERDFLLYLNLAALYGWDFEIDPDCQWMASALAQPVNSSPSERLQHLVDRCLDREARQRHSEDLRRDFGLTTVTREEL
jgi:hypothetical protein